MCDVVNMPSIRDVPKQLKTIYERTIIKDPVVSVFVNKVEVLDGRSNSKSSVMTLNRKLGTTLSIQEEALTNLEKILTKDYPQVTLHEISLRFGLNVSDSITKMGCNLKINMENYVRQEFMKNIKRQSCQQRINVS